MWQNFRRHAVRVSLRHGRPRRDRAPRRNHHHAPYRKLRWRSATSPRKASPLGSTWFVHTDWLGTERVRTPLSGTSETCSSLAYGDNLSCTGTDVSPMHFTGKMHDSETGLDDFPARYYSSTQGRWYSPDWASAQVPVPYKICTTRSR